MGTMNFMDVKSNRDALLAKISCQDAEATMAKMYGAGGKFCDEQIEGYQKRQKERNALQYALDNFQKQELLPKCGRDIEAEDIWIGILMGTVKFITDPNVEYGTVCSIGDHWFYFGGQTAEEESPAEYLRNVPLSDTINSVLDALNDFRSCMDTSDEYAYYAAVLKAAKKNAQAMAL